MSEEVEKIDWSNPANVVSKQFLYDEFKKWNQRAVLAQASLRTRESQLREALLLLAGTELCEYPTCHDQKCKNYREFLKRISDTIS